MTERLINVCEAINCPFAERLTPRSSSGCRKYSVAFSCHLIYPENGERRVELQRQSTEYFLYQVPSKINLEELRLENEAFLSKPEIMEYLEFEKEMNEND